MIKKNSSNLVSGLLKNEQNIEILGLPEEAKLDISTTYDKDNISILDIKINAIEPIIFPPLTLKWKLPAHNVKGVWKPAADFAKRIQADWELCHMESRISTDAPVVCLFGHDDVNVHTFACSDAVNKLELNARIREEDDCFHCFVRLFAEAQPEAGRYSIQIRIDGQDKHFSSALRDTSLWWEGLDGLKPAPVPDIALAPLYSTWYSFHQGLEEEVLVSECNKAYGLGYRSVIIDDGWQTNDGNRGYDFTGDWEPERFGKAAEFVEAVHGTGMKVGFWYSVPFCGRKSRAYRRFKGKFLTEGHRWAPVLDPRYPEVRSYLIDIYRNALLDWNLDGFKLDFIDDFRLYGDTPKAGPGMDTASVNSAVDRLLTDVVTALRAINPDVFIEFRQKYTGPAMRKYGNMFRAFDCPGDATMNRTRIADIRMLAGSTAVHSDMVTWHGGERLEVAALQMANTMFGVPQISVALGDIPEDHLDMVRFYTGYWNANKALITEGHFTPYRPLANYPLQTVSNAGKMLIGVHDDHVVPIDGPFGDIDILNAKLSESTVLKINADLGGFNCTTFNCKGELTDQKDISLDQGVMEIDIPACGLARLTKN